VSGDGWIGAKDPWIDGESIGTAYEREQAVSFLETALNEERNT
jgi:hypothetical protein